MLFKLAWRNIWRNKRRSIITITSIFVAVFLAIFMRSMQLGMYASMIENVVGSYSGYVQIHKNGYWAEQIVDQSMKMDSQILNKINKIEGVKSVLPRLQTYSLAAFNELSKGVVINGVVQEKENLLMDWEARLDRGNLLSGKAGEVVIARGIAEIFEVGLGDTMVFIGQGYHGTNAAGKYSISGIVNMKNPQLNNRSIFLNLETAQQLVGADQMITHLIVDKKEGANEEDIQAALQSSLGQNYEVMTWRALLPELEQTILADSVGGLIMVFILYMIISFGIFGTVLMMTQERSYEFGVLVSIGMKKVQLSITMILETLLLTFMGVCMGIISSFPLSYYFNSYPIVLSGQEGEMIEKFGFDPVIPLSIDPSIPLTHGLIIFVISLLISAYPCSYILRMNPIKSMKR